MTSKSVSDSSEIEFEVFPWENQLNTNIPVVDEQHKQLVKLLNKLAANLVNQTSELELHDIFKELADYAEYHFETEEKIWAPCFQDDAWFIKHQETHTSFIQEVSKLKDEVRTHSVREVVEDVVQFLIGWLAYHILDSDKRMAITLHEVEAGATLQDAKANADRIMSGSARLFIQTILAMYEKMSSRTIALLNERAKRKAEVDALLVQLKEQDLELQRQVTLLDSIINNVENVVIYSKDTSGKHLLINDYYEKAVGVTREQVIGKTDKDFMPAEVAEKLMQTDRQIININKTITLKEEVPFVDGTMHHYQTTKSPLHGIDGKVVGIVGISTDITDLVNTEERLQEAKNAAENANNAKSEFLSSMSHELRTPLNAIMGFSQLLEHDPALDEKQTDNAREIYKAGKHLVSMINQILDLAKIEAGRIELSMEPVSLEITVDECLASINPFALKNGITLNTDLQESAGCYVWADHTRLMQILLNLISNAVKYNRENGSVTIKSNITDEGLVRISIKDTGPGISDDQMDKLFKPFNRLGQEFGGIEGTGIGLVITREVLELMQGSIGVQSTVGEGSTFWFELPLTDAPQLAEATEEQAPADQHTTANDIPTDARILIAEDNLANQAVLMQQLELLGLKGDCANNGVEALQLWQNGDYALVLTDINMPLMDGLELVRQIRMKEAATSGHVPIIGITAHGMQDDINNYHESGMDGHLVKPASLNMLEKTLKEWLNKTN